MSLESYLAIAGGMSAAGMGMMLAIYAVRNSGLKAEAKEDRLLRVAAEVNLEMSTAQFNAYRARAEVKEARLVAELEHYENQELDNIETEPDRPKRIKRRRDWVRDILSRAKSPSGDNDSRGVRKETAT